MSLKRNVDFFDNIATKGLEKKKYLTKYRLTNY